MCSVLPYYVIDQVFINSIRTQIVECIQTEVGFIVTKVESDFGVKQYNEEE